MCSSGQPASLDLLTLAAQVVSCRMLSQDLPPAAAAAELKYVQEGPVRAEGADAHGAKGACALDAGRSTQRPWWPRGPWQGPSCRCDLPQKRLSTAAFKLAAPPCSRFQGPDHCFQAELHEAE